MDKNSYIAFYNRALCYTKINELQMVRFVNIFKAYFLIISVTILEK